MDDLYAHCLQIRRASGNSRSIEDARDLMHAEISKRVAVHLAGKKKTAAAVDVTNTKIYHGYPTAEYFACMKL